MRNRPTSSSLRIQDMHRSAQKSQILTKKLTCREKKCKQRAIGSWLIEKEMVNKTNNYYYFSKLGNTFFFIHKTFFLSFIAESAFEKLFLLFWPLSLDCLKHLLTYIKKRDNEWERKIKKNNKIPVYIICQKISFFFAAYTFI
jgi:hypothetical protein